jgi:hypothetical protein
VIAELRTMFDWVICDSPAGIERGATLAMRFADAAVIVANSEVSSVRDSDRIIGLLDSKTVKVEKGESRSDGQRVDGFDHARSCSSAMAGTPGTPFRFSLPSADSATCQPWSAFPTAPVPTSLLPCWVQTPPLRV